MATPMTGAVIQVERRSEADDFPDVEPVRLTRKYAECIDGIDLSRHRIGDRMPVPRRQAELLMAEGWAEPIPAEQRRRSSGETVRGEAGDGRRSHNTDK
jgi:hypothetical protein